MIKDASYVILNKFTNEVICEIFNKNLLSILNTEKYKAIPIYEYLCGLNEKELDEWAKSRDATDCIIGSR